MTEITPQYYIDTVKEKFDIDVDSDQGVENYVNLINHWIQNKNSGRAYFDNIPNDFKLDPVTVRKNIEAVGELVRVRRFCKRCEVTTPRQCLYDKKQARDAREWEKERGLALGTIKVGKLLSKICVENCGKPNEAEYEMMAMRPGLRYQSEQLYFGYGPCPVSDV